MRFVPSHFLPFYYYLSQLVVIDDSLKVIADRIEDHYGKKKMKTRHRLLMPILGMIVKRRLKLSGDFEQISFPLQLLLGSMPDRRCQEACQGAQDSEKPVCDYPVSHPSYITHRLGTCNIGLQAFQILPAQCK